MAKKGYSAKPCSHNKIAKAYDVKGSSSSESVTKQIPRGKLSK
jgi:hypothetical protein